MPPEAAFCPRFHAPSLERAAQVAHAHRSARASTSCQAPLLEFDESEFIAPRFQSIMMMLSTDG